MSDDTEKRLKEAILFLKKCDDLPYFITFLDAYREREAGHVRDNIEKQDGMDVRSAALCFEAMSAAVHMKELIDGDFSGI